MSKGTVNAEDQARRLQIKNRRNRYLDLHPEYFKKSHLELADPLLYDRLVRRFQTADERERDGREKGYSGVLEANFVRSEAKLEAMRNPDPNSPLAYTQAPDGSITAVEQDEASRARNREEGWEQWTDFMGSRFLKGDDGEFDYEDVDESDEYDDREEIDRRKLEEYLEAEEEAFVGDEKPEGETGVQDF